MKTFKRGKQKLILCRGRKILVLKTPEEQVRQDIIKFLIEEMKVPEEFISTEYPLKNIESSSKLRADIVVWETDQDGYRVPFLVMELKARHIELTDSTIQQVRNYNTVLNAKYIGVSNGDNTKFYEVIDDQVKQLTDNLYTYNELIVGRVNYEISKPMRRLPYELVTYDKYIKFIKENYIGQNTPDFMHESIAELQNYLLCGDVIPTGKFNHTIIADYSYGYFNTGNASGGNFPGFYRSFLVKDFKGNHNIYRISIFGTAQLEDDPVYGNRKGNTYLVVAIEKSGLSTNILQLNVDNFFSYNKEKNSFDIYHNGRRNGFTNQEVLQSVNRIEPKLLVSEKIVLGSLPSNRSIQVEEGSEVVERILAYAACRESLKKKKRKRKKIITS